MLGWRAAISISGAVFAILGCATTKPPHLPPPAPPDPVADEPRPAPPAPAPAAEPGALPFRMPCASDDLVGCTNACEEGIVEDCVTLGAMYLAGAAVTVDRERAAQLFRRACLRDSARGCLLLGDAYHAGYVPAEDGAPARDPHAEEVIMFRRACDGGANQGCVRAGRALAAGHGTARDPAQAAKLFAPPCERGNAEACLELGKLTQQGGVKRDAERALALFEKACGLGLPEGCLRASPRGEERSPRRR